MDPARVTWSTRTMMKAIAVIAFMLAVPRIYQSLRPAPRFVHGNMNAVWFEADRYWSDIAPCVGSVLIPAHLLLLSTRKPPGALIKLTFAIDYCVFVSFAMCRTVLVGPGSVAVLPDDYFTGASMRGAWGYILQLVRPQGSHWHQIVIMLILLVVSLRWKFPRASRVGVSLAIVGWRFHDWLNEMRTGRFFAEDGMPRWQTISGWDETPVFRSDFYEPIRLALLAGYLIAIFLNCREKKEPAGCESQGV